MKTKKLCVVCGERSITGLKKGIGLCQYHYNALMFESGETHKIVAAKIQSLVYTRRK